MKNRTAEEYYKNKAIKQSIRKWERICQNTTYVWMASGYCGLCYYALDKVGDLYCPSCPLHQAGFGCLEKGSTFRDILRLVDPRTMFPNDQFFDLIEIMYENVCSLMPDYDPQLEAKND